MGHDQYSCQKLVSQMRKYKMRRAPFNAKFSKSDDLTNWWETIRNADELQTLAL